MTDNVVALDSAWGDPAFLLNRVSARSGLEGAIVISFFKEPDGKSYLQLSHSGVNRGELAEALVALIKYNVNPDLWERNDE